MAPLRKMDSLPYRLKEIPRPPQHLYIEGTFPDEGYKFLTVVGSRRHSAYGKAVCEGLIEKLAGYPIVIVSGLALGIDSIAHRAALRAGLPTIAIPGSGLSPKVLYPKSNFALARQIVEAGGCLVSEFEPDFEATRWSFIQRNRLGAGISDAVLLIEADEKSGTLTTARFALEANREVLVVPGNITSSTSKGTNALLRDGAIPVMNSLDILEALGLTPRQAANVPTDLPPDEAEVLEALSQSRSREEIAQLVKKPVTETNITISILEMKGLVKEIGGIIHRSDGR